MAEIVSTSTATTVVAGATITALFASPDAADVFVGAFIGSIVFVVSAKDYSLFVRAALFCVSYMIGLTTSDFFADVIGALITAVVPGHHPATKLMGAIVSSAVSVRILMALTRRAADFNVATSSRSRGSDDDK